VVSLYETRSHIQEDNLYVQGQRPLKLWYIYRSRRRNVPEHSTPNAESRFKQHEYRFKLRQLRFSPPVLPVYFSSPRTYDPLVGMYLNLTPCYLVTDYVLDKHNLSLIWVRLKAKSLLFVINLALYHEDLWGSGCMTPLFLTSAVDGDE
jgi:hypothetical protein